MHRPRFCLLAEFAVVLVALAVPSRAEAQTAAGRFDIGGRSLAAWCEGEGSPTVVLETGAGHRGAVWAAVQAGVAPLTRVCAYDRANVPGGASDAAPTPRSAANLAADLRALLAAMAIDGPVVLVGHSFGGLVVRLAAADLPARVVGMVLIDTVHEDEMDRLQPLLSAAQWAAIAAGMTGLTPFERLDQQASWAEMRAAPPLPPMPLRVLAARRAPDTALPAPWPLAAEDALHQEMQAALAALVPGGRYAVVEGAGHAIHIERPEAVVETITAVVVEARGLRR